MSRMILSCPAWNLLKVQKLVRKGVDLPATDESAFRVATENGHLNVVQFLADHGADIHTKNEAALQHAALMGHLPVVQYLVSLGVDIHAENEQALSWAAGYGHLGVVQYLVAQDADVSVGLFATLRGSPTDQWLRTFQHSQEEKKILHQEPLGHVASISPKLRL